MGANAIPTNPTGLAPVVNGLPGTGVSELFAAFMLKADIMLYEFVNSDCTYTYFPLESIETKVLRKPQPVQFASPPVAYGLPPKGVSAPGCRINRIRE
jgi:hypothetical protein